MTMSRNVSYGILLVDLIYLPVAFVFAYLLHNPVGFSAPFLDATILLAWWPLLVTATGLWTVLYCKLQLDGFNGGWRFANLLSQLCLGVAILTVLLFSFAFLLHEPFSRLVVIYFGGLLFVGFVAIRFGASVLLRSHSRRGARRRVVILGNGNVARELARKISQHPELMCEVIGFLFPGGSDGQPSNSSGSCPVPTVGVIDLLRAHNANELLIALNDGWSSELGKLVALCRSAQIGISLVPQWYELYLSKAELLELDGLPMLSLMEHRPSPLDFAVKRVTDVALGSMFFLLALPLMVVAGSMLLVRGRRVFRVETRCGRDGWAFPMFRLNVDRDHPERLSGVESILARLSLTELPQLWNVLRGDMALVGPRPESADRVQHYSDWQRQRLAVRPGLTGLAQIHGLRDEHASEDKARFDIQYIYQWTPFLDLSIVLQTCWTLAVRLSSPARLAINCPKPEDVVVPPISSTEVRYADSSHSGTD
jgi:lipopolysaccharide/colanic/teichoic acid biosynthesis glycosyltransferase